MTLSQACEIIRIKAYANDQPFLEQMMAIKANPEDYNLEVLKAYYVVMEAGQRMFLPAGGPARVHQGRSGEPA
jgi:hypothetical protein